LDELERLGIGALRKAVVDGDIDNGSVMAGQIAALIKKQESCEEIINDFVEGTKELIKSMSNNF
jgi:enoyl-[acyl-carrier protein] reductase II